MTLADLGWTDACAAAFAPLAAPGREPARVTLQLKGFWEVTTPSAARLAECSGRFLNATTAATDMPVVGDWVVIEPLPGRDDRALIHAVLPRRTRFSRRAAGERNQEQVVAANVDVVFLVSALDAAFSLRRIERYLAAARASGADPVVVLNKADLVRDAEERREEAAAVAGSVPVVLTRALRRGGTRALGPWLRPRTTVAFLGSSGVGKSTLINDLLGDERLATQEVRAVDGKGRHTTTLRELVVAPGGVLVIDTPGMRELQPWQADEAVADVFADLRALTLRCRFTDCTHRTEPGCAVRAAAEAGALDAVRWRSYERLRREAVAEEARVADRRASQKGKTAWKQTTKRLRQRVRDRGGED